MRERISNLLDRRLATALTVAFGTLVTLISLAPAAFAQGCVMCYTSASAAGRKGERALDQAIVALLFPVLSLFVGILVFAWRRSRAASARAPIELLLPADSFPEHDVPLRWLPDTR
jgi:hypothetical protein